MIGKHFSVFFSLDFSSFSINKVHKKRLLLAIFAVLLLREKQKKPFVSTKEPCCFSNVFRIRYVLKTKRKPAKNNTEKCFPIHL